MHIYLSSNISSVIKIWTAMRCTFIIGHTPWVKSFVWYCPFWLVNKTSNVLFSCKTFCSIIESKEDVIICQSMFHSCCCWFRGETLFEYVTYLCKFYNFYSQVRPSINCLDIFPSLLICRCFILRILIGFFITLLAVLNVKSSIELTFCTNQNHQKFIFFLSISNRYNWLSRWLFARSGPDEVWIIIMKIK